MATTTQDELLAIETSLGKDVLFLTGFNGYEGISRLFSFELSMVSENHAISFDAIIGTNVTVAIFLSDGNQRYFHGLIASFSQGRSGGEQGSDTRFSSYRATMVPWLWLLSKTADSRIFQDLTIPDIVEKVFQKREFQDFSFRLQGSYEKRTYCVQYRETDFNFVSRLLEEEGMFYFFEHMKGKHTLVITDNSGENKPCPRQESASYHASERDVYEEDAITSLEMTKQITSGAYTLKDFNFTIPGTDLKVEVSGKDTLGPGKREIYDYPGLYEKKTQGSSLADIRMEEVEVQVTRISGSSSCRAFTSGYRFKLKGHFRSDLNNKEFVLVSVAHQASDVSSVDTGAAYSNQFECIPHLIPFRPLRITPKPLVQGSQTAIVVGPQGEEIYTDEHGRIKVQFHWDREGKTDDKSSCWIRVSQSWAGNGWGGMQIPRIGQEVIVDFLEGDPDQPIITGCVYNGANMPPYPLPGEKTKSTLKSNSSKGGGGFNEFRFEDKKGNEEIFLHGQKDWTIAILNDKNQTVGHDETLSVGNNRTKTVGVNQSETIGVNKDIAVGANHTEVIGANMALTVGSNKTETVAINTAETIGVAKELTIGGLYQVTVGAAMNETIGAAKAEEIGAAKSVNVGANSSENVGVNKSVDAGSNISESAGKNFSIDAGKDFSVKAGAKGVIDIADQLTIKCGDAMITMKKNGDITIKGKTITVKGSGDIVMKANKILQN